MNKRIYVFLLIITFSKMLFAAEEPTLLFDGGLNSLIANKNTFSISVDDQVTGGCLPNPNKLKDTMEISLRKNGFQIAKEATFFSDKIVITVLGYKTSSSSCVSHISTILYFPVAVRVPFGTDKDGNAQNTFTSFKHRLGSVVLTGERYSMQNRLEKEVKESGDKLFLDISRAKDDIYTKFPYIKENYENK